MGINKENAMDSKLIEEFVVKYSEKAKAKPVKYKSEHLLAKEYKESVLALQPVMDALMDDYGNLEALDMFCMMQDMDPAAMPDVKKLTCDAPNATGKMDMYMFCPENMGKDEKRPCVYVAHGGGLYTGTALMETAECRHLRDEAGAVVITYEYTCTKTAPYPAALHDAYAGLKYIYDHADELNIDRDKIILQGESGGASLSSHLSMYAKDKGEIPIKAQVLVYPNLDRLTGSKEDSDRGEYTGEFIITWRAIPECIAKMSGGKNIPKEELRYFAAQEAAVEEMKGLPPTFMIVGTLDAFVNEILVYGNKLIQAGVPTEIFVEPGVPHAYDAFGDDFPQKKRFNYLRDSFIKEMLDR